MVQERLRLGQRHPLRSNSSDNFVTRTSNALGIRNSSRSPRPNAVRTSLSSFAVYGFFAQTGLTFEELNAL